MNYEPSRVVEFTPVVCPRRLHRRKTRPVIEDDILTKQPGLRVLFL